MKPRPRYRRDWRLEHKAGGPPARPALLADPITNPDKVRYEAYDPTTGKGCGCAHLQKMGARMCVNATRTEIRDFKVGR